jgi:hypothetical protein
MTKGGGMGVPGGRSREAQGLDKRAAVTGYGARLRLECEVMALRCGRRRVVSSQNERGRVGCLHVGERKKVE